MPFEPTVGSNLFSIATTVSGVFLVMAVGAFARYMKWFTSEVDRSLAGFTTTVLLPSFFFHRIMTDPKLSGSLSDWMPSVYGAALTAFGFGVSLSVVWLAGRWFNLNTMAERQTFALCSGIANYGYIPVPLAEAFYPGCIVTLLVHNVGVDIALWSIGLFIISGKKLSETWRRVVFSPPLVSVAIALTVRQLGFQTYIPKPFLHMSEQLGRCSIPIGLVLSGAIVYDFAGRVQFSSAWRPWVLAVIVRIVLLPTVFLVIAKYGNLSRDLQEVILLQAAMPSATFPLVMTRLYDKSVETAWTVVVGTSLLGIVTIPLWMVFGAYWLGF